MKTKEEASKEMFPEGTIDNAIRRKHYEDGWQHCLEELAKHQAKIIGEANAQANVSGNEANQSENKKVGEVAVAFAEWIRKSGWGYWKDNTNMWHFGGQSVHHKMNGKTTEQLFDEFQKAKATDR